jgi:hypothetical protein
MEAFPMTAPDRKELKRAYKEAPVEAGIWLIRNLKSGKILLGSALNLDSRLNRHQFALAMKKHECKELQADWDQAGVEQFSFERAEVLEKPTDNAYFDVPGELKRLETLWLQNLRPYGDKGYHIGG